MTLLLALSLTLQTAPTAPSPRVLWDTHEGPLRARGLIATMDATAFRTEALKVLSPSSVRIGYFTVYPTMEDWVRARGAGGTDCSYESWRGAVSRRNLDVRPLRCPVISQAIKIGGAILVRQIDSTCQHTQQLLRGKTDPFAVTLSGTEFRILDITIQEVGPDPKDRFAPLHIFATTDQKVTKERAEQLLRFFMKLSGAPDLSVILRNDQWFVEQSDFPLLYLFGGVPSVIPSKGEFLRSSQAVCGKLKQWPVGCY